MIVSDTLSKVKKLDSSKRNVFSKQKSFTYNLVGKKKLSLWDLYKKIAQKKNKKVVKINTKFLNFIKKSVGRNKIIRNNDFLNLKRKCKKLII